MGDITSNLDLWYKFDDRNYFLADDSAGSHDGSLIRSPAWTTGRCGGALDFDGSTNYVDTYYAVSFAAGFTLACWFKTTRNYITNQWAALLGASDISGAELYELAYGNAVIFGADNTPFILMKTGGGSISAVSTKSGLSDGAWHLYVAGRDGSNQIFLSVDNETIVIGGTLTGTITPGLSMIIGDRRFGQIVPSQPIQATIDEVRVYSRGLAQGDIGDLYAYLRAEFSGRLSENLNDERLN